TNEANPPADEAPGATNKANAPSRCGSPAPAAGATAGLPPGPGRAGDPQPARCRDSETSPADSSPETVQDPPPDPRESDETWFVLPRRAFAPDDRLPTASEPVAVEPAAHPKAQSVTNEADPGLDHRVGRFDVNPSLSGGVPSAPSDEMTSKIGSCHRGIE